MEHKKICCDSVYDRLPPLSPKYPWFVAQNLKDEELRYQIFYTIHKPLYEYRSRIPELLGRQIRTCFHGWVILSDHPHDILWSLWNPVTCELIHLPLLEGDFHQCCLSSPPDDPTSVFLLTHVEKPIIMFCWLAFETKNLTWTEISYANQLRSITNEKDVLLHSLTCCNGKVYSLHTGIECDCFVIHVDINIMVNEKQVVISLLPLVEVPNPSFTINPSFFRRPCLDGCTSLNRVHILKGSCTELFYVEIDFEDETLKIVSDVCLYKLDMISMMWEEMEDLNDAVFFIELANDSSIYYTSTIASEFGGCIHILDTTGETIYSYHVKDRTISLSSMSSMVQTTKVSSWAMLEFRLEGDYGEAKCATANCEQEKYKDKKIVVRSAMADEVESNKSFLLSLPFHLLEMILELCLGVEFLNFRATCKLCHLAAPLIQWSKKTTLTRLQTYSLGSPWLIVLEKHQMTFTDPKTGNNYFIKNPQELTGDWCILCSRYGWLLMFERRGSLMFFQPFTKDILKLPQEVPCLKSCSFTAPPTSPDCMVVGLIRSFDTEWQVYIHFVAWEPNEQRIIHLNVGDSDPYYLCFPTHYGGEDLCVLSNEGKLYVYKDFSEEPLVVETPGSRCKSAKQNFQVKCDQHLLLVIVGKFGESIEVFKLNDVTKEWEKVDSLGKHAIYICDYTCLYVEAKTPDMENKIYFPRLHSENGNLVFYSLETQTFHTFIGSSIKESLEDLLGTTHHCNPHAWIEPRRS